MRKRNIKKQFWIDVEEEEILKQKAKKANLKEAPFIRSLILGYKLKEKPDERFYAIMKEIRGISNNLNQIARKANALGFIDVKSYQCEIKKLNDFYIKFKEEFLIPTK